MTVTYARILALGEGLHYCGHKPSWLPFGFGKGWITIEKDNYGRYTVLWSKKKETHNLLFHGPSFYGAYNENELVSVYKTALTFWEARNEEQRNWYSSVLKEKILNAYDWNL